MAWSRSIRKIFGSFSAGESACQSPLNVMSRSDLIKHSPQGFRSTDPKSMSEVPRQSTATYFGGLGLLTVLGYSAANWYSKRSLSYDEKDFNQKMMKPLEDIGITREICESKISELEEKIESGAALQTDRYNLSIYRGWLGKLTRVNT